MNLEERVARLERTRNIWRLVLYLYFIMLVILLFMIFMIQSASAYSLPTTSNHNPYHRPIKTIPQLEEVKSVASSGRGGCITNEWVWTGEKWQGRDLLMPSKKVLSGKYCVVFDMKTRRVIPKPAAIPESLSMSYYNEPIDAGWYRK